MPDDIIPLASNSVKKTRSPNTVDVLVGVKLKQRREHLRQSLALVAEQVDISAAQLLKYERAESRVPASRLSLLAMVLQVSITYFFEGDGDRCLDEAALPVNGEPSSHDTNNDVNMTQIFELLECFKAIDGDDRSRALQLLRLLVSKRD